MQSSEEEGQQVKPRDKRQFSQEENRHNNSNCINVRLDGDENYYTNVKKNKVSVLVKMFSKNAPDPIDWFRDDDAASPDENDFDLSAPVPKEQLKKRQPSRQCMDRG